MVELLEVFKDVEVVVKGGSLYGRYKALYAVKPIKNPKKIGVKDLKEYAERLNKRYPDRHFYVQHVKIGELSLHVLDQKPQVKVDLGDLKARLRKYQSDIKRAESEYNTILEEREKISEELKALKDNLEAINKRFILIRLLLFRRRRRLEREIEEKSKELKAAENRLEEASKRLERLRKEAEELNEAVKKGGVKRVKGRLPIYFDLSKNPPRVFVEKKMYEKNPKLANYILMRTLGALGLAQSRYVKTIGRR
ncbi:MAG: hypothetical protein ACTSXC_03060 [Candidatus Freyarchaeota archaeon]